MNIKNESYSAQQKQHSLEAFFVALSLKKIHTLFKILPSHSIVEPRHKWAGLFLTIWCKKDRRGGGNLEVRGKRKISVCTIKQALMFVVEFWQGCELGIEAHKIVHIPPPLYGTANSPFDSPWSVTKKDLKRGYRISFLKKCLLFYKGQKGYSRVWPSYMGVSSEMAACCCW